MGGMYCAYYIVTKGKKGEMKMKTFIITKKDISCNLATSSYTLEKFKKPIDFVYLHVNNNYLCLYCINDANFLVFSGEDCKYEPHRNGIRLFLTQPVD